MWWEPGDEVGRHRRADLYNLLEQNRFNLRGLDSPSEQLICSAGTRATLAGSWRPRVLIDVHAVPGVDRSVAAHLARSDGTNPIGVSNFRSNVNSRVVDAVIASLRRDR